MSYCQRGLHSDIYLYQINDGTFECNNCSLIKAGDFSLESVGEVYDHLIEHKKAGHKVPYYAIMRAREEMD